MFGRSIDLRSTAAHLHNVHERLATTCISLSTRQHPWFAERLPGYLATSLPALGLHGLPPLPDPAVLSALASAGIDPQVWFLAGVPLPQNIWCVFQDGQSLSEGRLATNQ